MNAPLIIHNEFLYTKKFSQQVNALLDAFSACGVNAKTATNANALALLSSGYSPRFVVFFDKDIALLERLEGMGLRVFNSSACIGVCDDKARQYNAFERAGLSVPKTIVSPFCYGNIEYSNTDFVDDAIEKLGLPLVVKERSSSFGMGVSIANSKADILARLKSTKGLVFQRLIQSCGDVRVYVVGGRVVCAVKRENQNDFRFNVANGGIMSVFDAPNSLKQLAISAAGAVGAAFAGVDFLVESGEFLLSEVNAVPHFVAAQTVCGVSIAAAAVKYFVDETA